MEFEWDEAKCDANVRKHGIDFVDAIKIFSGPIVTRRDDRFDYGEVRNVSTGLIDGLLIVTVVHTDRHGTKRIISARRASHQERNLYETALRASPDNR